MLTFFAELRTLWFEDGFFVPAEYSLPTYLSNVAEAYSHDHTLVSELTQFVAFQRLPQLDVR